MGLRQGVGVVSDPEAAERSCDIVRRYVTDALFGGDERVLRETVADPMLQERAWLFWAAFNERSLDEIDVLFANADGSRVACHLAGNMIQEGPWITSAPAAAGGLVMIECTGTYVVDDGKITNFRETWR
jgi:limonene-1,2-epoxide hydrolase